MNAMHVLVKDFEWQVSQYHGFSMENKIVRQLHESYSIQYNIGDGAIYIIATSDNELSIAILEGKQLGWSKEIYSTPYISNISKAEELLAFIEQIIDESLHSGYNEDIHAIVAAIKSRYSS